ncbi:acyl carrier protein [Candidatus Nitrospira nitrificans]|uniref:Putative Acyl carrier protein n=1 Tax=Candidatus Nitrospira nitrificans TaxID=1742973 RepID=A0A0S4L253_9BACT|nr:acyl carrier protein [Candidatus Nitrospira nitrificans]CUS31745.1 putative Acyl carrier protein [Candidatus Nitrospira nitrificans]
MTIEAIVGKVFNLDPWNVTDSSSKDTLAEWDSMGHLSLITSLEEHYKVSLSIADAMEMTSVGKIKAILKGYGISS